MSDTTSLSERLERDIEFLAGVQERLPRAAAGGFEDVKTTLREAADALAERDKIPQPLDWQPWQDGDSPEGSPFAIAEREALQAERDSKEQALRVAVLNVQSALNHAEARVSALQRDNESMEANSEQQIRIISRLREQNAELQRELEARKASCEISDNALAEAQVQGAKAERELEEARELSEERYSIMLAQAKAIESLRLEVELADEGRREEVTRLREQLERAGVTRHGMESLPCRDCGGVTIWISDAWTTCPACVTRSRDEIFRAFGAASHASMLALAEESARLREQLAAVAGRDRPPVNDPC